MSDQGSYAEAVIGLAGTLFHADQLWSNHFWRTQFERLAGRDDTSRSETIEAVANWVLKQSTTIVQQLQEGREAAARAWARHSVDAAEKLSRKVRTTDLGGLAKALVKERECFAEANEGRTVDTSLATAERDLRETLQYFVQRRVLFQGVRARCTNCGSPYWYSVRELDDTLTCRGCQSPFPLPVESPWSYSLNALVAEAVGYGVPAVVIAAGQLLGRARTSWIYTPGVEVVSRDNRERQVEFDIVAVHDGRFVLAEVKTRAEEFHEPILRTLAGRALELRADVLALGALSEDVGLMTKHAQFVEGLLAGSRCAVELLLPHTRALRCTDDV